MRDTSEHPDKPIRVLLVHAERGIRFSVADFFRAKGFVVKEVDQPEAGAAALRSEEFDVLLTDYHFARRAGEGLALATLARLARLPPVTCLLAPPLGPEEAGTASSVVDLLITGPRPLADVAQMLFALLQKPAAAHPHPTERGS